MLKRRIALAGVVVIVAALGAAPAGWADNSGPPKPHVTGQESGNGAFVCHSYPGARVNNNDGIHGTPGQNLCND